MEKKTIHDGSGIFADLEKPILSVGVFIKGNQVSQISHKKVSE